MNFAEVMKGALKMTNLKKGFLVFILVVLAFCLFGCQESNESKYSRAQKLLSDKLSADLGYVYENLVAQMLVAADNRLFYHTWPTETGKHNYDIDFLLSRGNKICPIEVKSSGYMTHVSLDRFQEKFSSRIGNRYMVYPKDLRKDKDLLCVPVFMTMFL